MYNMPRGVKQVPDNERATSDEQQKRLHKVLLHSWRVPTNRSVLAHLQLDFLPFNVDKFCLEINSDSGDESGGKCVPCVSQKETGLADTTVSDHQHFHLKLCWSKRSMLCKNSITYSEIWYKANGTATWCRPECRNLLALPQSLQSLPWAKILANDPTTACANTKQKCSTELKSCHIQWKPNSSQHGWV